jgi:DNA polymerase
VYWRPPGNRTPTPQEIQVCRPFLERQIELVAPDVMMTLGGPAATALLGIEGGIMRARGRWRELEIGGRSVPVMPTLHPAYLLRTPLGKRLAWRDLLAVQERMLAARVK